MCKLAKLTEPQLKDIRQIEAKWKSIVLLAYEKPPELANLSSEQVRRLQKLEKELSVSLMAYK
jgi:hypothetical protein